ncbi:MAG: hypothetical protein VKL59_06375 [Nostocaceae cyanobacterium]|nr:hypothetical protein [Nostocaceae cyanobacterium]
MRQFLNALATISAVGAIATVPVMFSVNPASAETGMNGSYIGVGGGVADDLGVITLDGRVQVGSAPVSLRPSLLYAPSTGDVAGIATVTYDAPIAQNTNLYLGAGGAFNDDFSSFALQAGIETAVSDNVVIYGDATYVTETSEVPVKVGIGYRF